MFALAEPRRSVGDGCGWSDDSSSEPGWTASQQPKRSPAGSFRGLGPGGRQPSDPGSPPSSSGLENISFYDRLARFHHQHLVQT